MTFTKTELDRFRADTPACQEVLHFNNAGAALQPTVVQEAVSAHLDLEYRLGGYEAAAIRAKESASFYSTVAQLLNAKQEEIAFATSATDAYNRALSAIPFETGDLILTTENDYVSNQIAFLQIKKRFGVEVRIAPESEAGGVDVEALQELIRQLHPVLVAVTHMPTSNGLIQDVYSIGKTCREEDVIYLVDACQTAGQLPLDVETMGCDFLSATARKFLRGPRGSGFLFVSQRIIQKGWAPQYLDLHSALWTAYDQFEPQVDARRFELWERNHAMVQGASAAVDYALTVGLDRIADYTASLAASLREQLQEIPNLQITDQGEQLGAIVTFHISEQDPQQLLQQLRAEKVHGSISWGDYARYDMGRKAVPWVLRWSPHCYNTIEEVEKATKKIFKIICC